MLTSSTHGARIHSAGKYEPVQAADFAKMSPKLIGDLIGKLPRGCQACISGFAFNIREQLEHVVNVDLEHMQVIK